MKILVGADTPPDPDSGAAGTVYATSVALRELGCKVDEVWSADLPHRISHWNLHYLLELPRAYQAAVRKRCSTGEYDVIQLSQPHAWMAARDHQRSRRRGVFVNRSHGLESMASKALGNWPELTGGPSGRSPRKWLTPMLRRRLHRHIDLVARYSDGLIVPAQEIREHLVREHGANSDRVRVIPHGVPDSFLTTPQSPQSPARLKRILHVGQFSAIKAPQLIARAAERILAEAGDATMTWVCGRAHHGAVSAMFPPSLRDRISLLDWRPQPELIALHDAHGLFLAHSLYEGAAKACTEAMARGQILLSSSVGALKDHVREGENGFLVEVGDVEGMASLALEVMHSPDRARAVGVAASRTAATLSWSRCAREAVEFYRSLLQLKN